MSEDERGLGVSANGNYSAANRDKAWTRYPQTIDPGYYQAIGEICARWAWLEFQLGVIAREMVDIKKREGFSILGGMSMRSITTVLIALTIGDLPKNANTRSAIADLAKKLYNVGDLRNEYAHALWGYENEQNSKLGVIKLRRPEDRNELNWIDKPLMKVRQDAEFLAGLQGVAQEITDALKGRRSRFA